MPYTDEDLIVEAARQHHAATEDPDFMGVGEQMDGEEIESTKPAPERREAEYPTIGERGSYWEEACAEDQYDAAQRKIHDLITDAADMSAWAVRAGADGLEPHGDAIDSGAPDGARVRIHFAFSNDVPADARTGYIANARRAITGIG